MSNYISFTEILKASKVEDKIQPESIDKDGTFNKLFNQVFDVFGDDLININNLREIRKICPSFKRNKKFPKITNNSKKMTQGEMRL